jgi:hypothetical protein
MSLPTRPERKQPISADAVSRLIEETRAKTLGSNRTGHVHHRGAGTLMFRPPTGLRPAASMRAAYSHPFQVLDASTPTPAAKVVVVFGQVNSITPTIGGTAINNATPPTLTVVSGTVYLNVTLDGDKTHSLQYLFCDPAHLFGAV